MVIRIRFYLREEGTTLREGNFAMRDKNDRFFHDAPCFSASTACAEGLISLDFFVSVSTGAFTTQRERSPSSVSLGCARSISLTLQNARIRNFKAALGAKSLGSRMFLVSGHVLLWQCSQRTIALRSKFPPYLDMRGSNIISPVMWQKKSAGISISLGAIVSVWIWILEWSEGFYKTGMEYVEVTSNRKID